MKQIFKILSCLSLVTLGTIAHAMESKQPSSQDPTLKWELIPNDNAGEPSSCPLPQNQASRPSDSKEFFKHFPLRGCLYSPTTDQYTLYPFQGYSGETNIFAGHADLKGVQKIMKGSGYSPVQVKGQSKAYAYIYFNRLTSSTVGDYFELFTFYAAYKTNDKGAPVHSVAWPEGTSTAPVAALGVPGVVYYFDRAYLSNEDAIRYGRSLMGFNKKNAEITISDLDESPLSPANVNRKFNSINKQGQAMLKSQVTEKVSDFQDSIGDLVTVLKANGFPTEFPDPKKPQMWLVVSRLPGGPMETTYFYNQQTSLFRKFEINAENTFELGNAPFAKELKKLKFQPTALIWSRDIIASLESPKWLDPADIDLNK